MSGTARTTENQLEKTFDQLFNELTKFLQSFDHLEPTLSFDPDTFANGFDPTGKRSLDDYRAQLAEFSRVLNVVTVEMHASYTLDVFSVDCGNFRQDTRTQMETLNFALLGHAKQWALAELRELQDMTSRESTSTSPLFRNRWRSSHR
jgi:hypothetical protein